MIILISTEQMRVKLQGNGETKNFSFPFLLNKKTDLLVRTWDGETLRTVTDWTVEPVNGIWPTTGGTVVYPLSASPVASNITVIIERDIDIIQSDSYQRNDSLSMTSLERTFDSNVQRIQEVQDRALRAVVLPVQSDYEDIDPRLPIPKPNMGFYWDETGTKLVEGMNPKEATERAEAAAAAAKVSEKNAKASEKAAVTAAANAKASETAAKASETNAKASEKEAAASASAAEISARNSAMHAQDAATSEYEAKWYEKLAKEHLKEIEQVAIKAKMPLEIKGSVATYRDLIVEAEREKYDAWLVEDTGKAYMWNGTSWQEVVSLASDKEIRALFDSSATPDVDDTYTTATDEEIQSVCAGKSVDTGDPTEYDSEVSALFSGQVADSGTATDADSGVEALF